MNLYRSGMIAQEALRRNPLRAALTTLGIIIGVSAVIAMVEIGNGSSEAIQKTISSMGANNLLVMPGAAASGGVNYGGGTEMTLTPEDADAIGRELPSILAASPVVRSRSQLNYGARNWVPQNIYGTGVDYLIVRDWDDLAAGTMFTENDVRTSAKVCILGSTVVRELFAGEEAVGKEIRIQNASFRVIGVLASKGANMMGTDQDDVVIAPWTSVKFRIASTAAQPQATPSNQTTALYPQASNSTSSTSSTSSSNVSRFITIDQVLTAARSPEEIDSAMEQITTLLRQRHRLREGDVNDFSIRDMTEMAKVMKKTSGLMTTLLLVVALISLVVGGVGIMNIMLVSVTERTKEIGLRMAVGATSGDIMRQFLIESIVLCLVGGALGIALGRGVSLLVSGLLGWAVATSFTAMAVSVLVSAAVGLLFGFYPARKAARMDPIEALRYE